MDRREFLAATAAALSASGCHSKAEDQNISKQFLHPASEIQKSRKRPEPRSTVGLIRCQSYDEDIFSLLKAHLPQLHLSNFKGKRVVIKPNMVEYEANHPITTNPAVIAAAVKLVDYLGAREIIIAEGPGHMRDTELLLAKTGIGACCTKLGLPFVDLNLDDIEAVAMSDLFTGMTEVFMPKTILDADIVVSVPKLKTHHWVGVTCSMKNLFGTVPGRKYGWPKNILHIRGIPRWIIDLQHIVRPQLAIVDAIISMEGDGPIMGKAKHTGFIAIGADQAAVDATCIRAMEFSFADIPYIDMAGEVVGNIEEDKIDIVATPLNSLKTPFEKPLSMIDKSYLVNANRGGS